MIAPPNSFNPLPQARTMNHPNDSRVGLPRAPQVAVASCHRKEHDQSGGRMPPLQTDPIQLAWIGEKDWEPTSTARTNLSLFSRRNAAGKEENDKNISLAINRGFQRARPLAAYSRDSPMPTPTPTRSASKDNELPIPPQPDAHSINKPFNQRLSPSIPLGITNS